MKFKILNFIVYLIVRALHATYRYRTFGMENRKKAEAVHPKGSFAIACWHGNCLSGILAHVNQKICPLCSHSPDGQMVAFLCRNIGLYPINGSSSRGGETARREMTAKIADGYSVALTVDGPRGPIHKSKPGIVDIARKSGIAILPIAGYSKRYWELRSWDRFRIPKPFSTVNLVYGNPIFVEGKSETQDYQTDLDQVDRELMRLEDIYFGSRTVADQVSNQVPAAPSEAK